MINIHKNTLKDLEFYTVLEQTSVYCLTEIGKDSVLSITPFNDLDRIVYTLKQTHEFMASFENENQIPNHNFQDIAKEAILLEIENNFLEIKSFKNIKNICITTLGIIKFITKFKTYYSTLFHKASQIEITNSVSKAIDRVIDKDDEIYDDVNTHLANIRLSLNSVKKKLDSSFSKALLHYKGQGVLDDIKESVIENKRVLAVKAMCRKRVKGTILGTSKTGSIVFIEPENTSTLHRELNNLIYEEQEEIIKILKQLTDTIRPYKSLLISYQNFLSHIDVVYAKAKYAESINAILPKINDNKTLELRDAYHPLLYLDNKEKNQKTYPQTITLTQNSRIIVISGPNAGGKSITLKTVGLLQIMLQSGFLVPVYERSTMCVFDRILSDIGDNQSIENHLSTYSYRLKQMNYFLKKCNANTLFLIDEFGTGSDPELGGALAEAILEFFYERETFGVITTHYANLKLLANELPFMQNANMVFDERSLQPKFQLVLGQAGSSFTFEVAQKNGIPFNLINKAKKKIERSKVRFDRSIVKLQKERSKLEQTQRSLKHNVQKTSQEADKLETTNQRIQKKLESYQELYDNNQRLIYLGTKVDTAAETYFENKRKRELMAELYRIVQIENSKRKKIPKHQKITQKRKTEKLKADVSKKIKVIRKQKKQAKQLPKIITPKPVLKVGDMVRLEDGVAVGSIDKIEKNKAVVNYGKFTTKVSVEQLELVETSS